MTQIAERVFLYLNMCIKHTKFGYAYSSWQMWAIDRAGTVIRGVININHSLRILHVNHVYAAAEASIQGVGMGGRALLCGWKLQQGEY